MSGKYLLDTNAVSDLVRNPGGPIAERIARIGVTLVCTSVVVAAELHFGATKRGSRQLLRQLEAVLAGLDILALETPSDRVYGQLRTDLERRGRPIGSNDMLIAAHALTLGCTLVTANEREFSRIEGLKIENWLRPLPN
ncbi:MAG TPA: type II toxin-antitoxin system VapC family toxin [Stellaceae bacterium]|nr:type II toxin-antitoxin system VapC family toxin [Stellaceae bacterium]